MEHGDALEGVRCQLLPSSNRAATFALGCGVMRADMVAP